MPRFIVRTLAAALLLGVGANAFAQQGQRILGYFEEDEYWYPGTIYTIRGNHIQLRFDSGEAGNLPAHFVKSFDWRAGTAVECNYQGAGEWYAAELVQLRGQNLQVVYDEDGEYEWTTTARCRSE